MIASIRRIANALLFVAILALSMSLLSSVTMHCVYGDEGCLVSVYTQPSFEGGGVDGRLMVTEHMPSYSDEDDVTFEESNTLILLVSGYALLVSVLILTLLECFEFYYLRRFFRRSSTFS